MTDQNTDTPENETPAADTPEVKPYVDDSIKAEGAAPTDGPTQEEFDALKEQVLRYAAQVENTKKRAEKEVADARNFAVNKFAQDLLGVADNLGRALANKPTDNVNEGVSGFITGVEMTEKELMGAFARNGLKPVAPLQGDDFNPHLHQAMAEAPVPGQKAGTVVNTVQTGYELMGRILRPAMVVVAARGADKTSEGLKQAESQDPGANIDQKM